MRKSILKFFVVMLAFFGVITFGKMNVTATETPELSWEVIKYDVTTGTATIRFSIEPEEGYLAYYCTTTSGAETEDEMFEKAVKEKSNSFDFEMICDSYRFQDETSKYIYFFATDETGEVNKGIVKVDYQGYYYDYFMPRYYGTWNVDEIFLKYGDKIEWKCDDISAEEEVEITFLENANFSYNDKNESTSDVVKVAVYYGDEWLATHGSNTPSTYWRSDFSDEVYEAGEYTFVYWVTGDVNTKPSVLTYTYNRPEKA